MSHTLPPVTCGKHANNIDAKADRCMPLITEWADNMAAAATDTPTPADRATALRAIEHGLTGGHGEAVAEVFWGALGKLHDERHPDAPGRKPTVFNTSRPVILAKLDREAFTIEQPDACADPFACFETGAEW